MHLSERPSERLVGVLVIHVQDHWDSKHSKLPWDPTQFQDTHAANGGVTTAGVGVRGSIKKEKK